ncbi:MAG TPA: AMP-binding protein, partial [Pyrinomonadaceae bacterium]|nr:AMP-binding protein [Pyrinomonadaceae bacterium]
SAFFALLHRLSGQSDITVGTAIAGRTRPETEPLIGLFLNTLVLRASPSPSLSFLGLLDQVRLVTLGAYSNQDVPIEKVIEALHPERRLSHNPLFQVMFIYQNAAHPPDRLGEVAVRLEEVDNRTAKFDLTLELMEGGEGEAIGGWIEYSTELFDRQSIARVAEQYLRLLEAMLERPQRAIGEAGLLGRGEMERVVYGWNMTEADFERGLCLHELVQRRAAISPDAVAVEWGSAGEAWPGQMSYGQLNDTANRLAHYLISCGIGADDIVAVWLDRSAQLLVSLLGVLKAGGAYLPVDTSQPPARLSFMLEDSAARAVITTRALAGKLSAQSARVICIDEQWGQMGEHCAADPVGRTSESNLAYLIYTSGSTGKPKAVAVEHRSVVNYSQAAVAAFNLGPSDRVLQFASVSFDTSAEEIFPTLMAGAALVLRDEVMTGTVGRFLGEC